MRSFDLSPICLGHVTEACRWPSKTSCIVLNFVLKKTFSWSYEKLSKGTFILFCYITSIVLHKSVRCTSLIYICIYIYIYIYIPWLKGNCVGASGVCIVSESACLAAGVPLCVVGCVLDGRLRHSQWHGFEPAAAAHTTSCVRRLCADSELIVLHYSRLELLSGWIHRGELRWDHTSGCESAAGRKPWVG